MKVLIDTMNLVFRNYNVARSKVLKEKGEFTENDIGFFYHTFLRDINNLTMDYGNVIFCTEGKGSLSLRRSIYPAYKRNRDASKGEDSYHIIKNEFENIEKVLTMYPTKVISVEGAEADDTIYALAMYFADLGEDVLVVSGDGDLTQLSLFNNKIMVFDPRKREIVAPNPNIIKFKAIVGDPADGISGLHRIGAKTFEKMMLSESLFLEKMAGKEKEYEDLLSIVDLRKYPKEYHTKAVEIYNSTEWNKFKPEEIERVMNKYALVQHLQFWWSNVSEIYEALQEVKDHSVDVSDIEEMDIENLLDILKKESV